MKVLVKFSAVLENEEWVEVDDNLFGEDLQREIEEIGNELVIGYFNGGDGDYTYEIVDTIDPDEDEDDDDYYFEEDDEGNEEDYDYEPSDPDSVGTFINEDD